MSTEFCGNCPAGSGSTPAEEQKGLPADAADPIALIEHLSDRYQLASLRPLLQVCRSATQRAGLNLAILGRFKAGKSSFINHLIGRPVLPVGVVPVTAVVTEIGFGERDTARVRFAGGRETAIPLSDVRLYVTEAENPLNRRHAEIVTVHVPQLARWPALRFIDTPGLESAFAHNTEASLGWAPNADIAVIAIGVDPPLSERDIALIEKLFRYTPRVAVLLTKADILEPNQLQEVEHYVRSQLAARFHQSIPVYPYSTRPGFEELQHRFANEVLDKAAGDVVAQRHAVLQRKLASLVSDCEQYVRLTLKSAEMLDSERLRLAKQLMTEEKSLADTRLQVQLIAQHAIAGTRATIERVLEPYESTIRRKLLSDFEEGVDQFPRRLAGLIDAFGDWLHNALSTELLTLSSFKRNEFVQPLTDAQRQYRQLLQNFRDRLSDKTLAIYGVPLKTTEPEIVPEAPKTPDVSIGKVFDHNWELLSPVLPMALLRGPVLTRFRQKIEQETFKNLSRLTSQWQDAVIFAILEVRREAEKRIEGLLATVQGLVSASRQNAPQIRADLQRLQMLADRLESEPVEHPS